MSFFGKLFGKNKKTAYTPTRTSSYSSSSTYKPAYTPSYTPSAPAAPAVAWSEGFEVKENAAGALIIKGIGECTDTELNIPEKIDGRPVVGIGLLAFNKNRDITEVNIPDSVTEIAYSAFSYCQRLETVDLGKVKSIGDNAFQGCAITSITIPDTVTSIPHFAFADCGALTEVYIPNSVNFIGECAFKYCDDLTEINYDGTAEEWRKIRKISDWHKGVSFITIVCRDEELDLDTEDQMLEEENSYEEEPAEEREKTDEELDAEVIAEFSQEYEEEEENEDEESEEEEE